jgi:hypothetical protein
MVYPFCDLGDCFEWIQDSYGPEQGNVDSSNIDIELPEHGDRDRAQIDWRAKSQHRTKDSRSTNVIIRPHM